jgi:hypothetical protein
MVGEFDWKVTGAPLDAVALKVSICPATAAVAGGVKVSVCAVREIWNVRGMISEAK